MNAILASIHPEFIAAIKAGEKTLELRKSSPNKDTPYKVYMYCTKDRYCGIMSGKVVGEFICKHIYYINGPLTPLKSTEYAKRISSRVCLTVEEIDDYLNGKYGCLWEISDVKFYNYPMALSEFREAEPCPRIVWCDEAECSNFPHDCDGRRITRPPQSWRYVQEIENYQ